MWICLVICSSTSSLNLLKTPRDWAFTLCLGGCCLSKKSIDGGIFRLICIHYLVIIFICVACSEEVICNETNDPREKFPGSKEKMHLAFLPSDSVFVKWSWSMIIVLCQLVRQNTFPGKLLSLLVPSPTAWFSLHCTQLLSTEIEIVNKQKDKVECNRAWRGFLAIGEM